MVILSLQNFTYHRNTFWTVNIKSTHHKSMWDPKTMIKASGILIQMTDGKVSIFFIQDHFQQHYKGEMDVVNCYESIINLTNELTEIRSDKENRFTRIFRDANAMAVEIGKEIKFLG